jgi:diaminopimelate epimerase
MKFTKMHGAGNDFVLVETQDTQRDWPAVAVDVCDRHFGIGADGLLLLIPSTRADFQMRIFNTDGSEADACGNGLRCAVKYFVDRSPSLRGKRGISVETRTGIRSAVISKEAGKIVKVKVGMGEPRFEANDIPVVLNHSEVKIESMIASPVTIDGEELELSLVSMGNPHAVHFMRDPVANFPLSAAGPKVENHRVFPQRVNFEVARSLSRKQIEARVWERGVGETLACGSGACAIAVAARLYGYIDDTVSVKLPGGVLEVEWDGAREVFLSGPAQTVFCGEWPDEELGKR